MSEKQESVQRAVPKHIETFRSARRVGVPILALNTPDPGAAIVAMATAANGQSVKVEWDIVRGCQGRGEAGRAWVAENIGADFDGTKNNPVGLFELIAAKLPEGGIVFVHLAHRWFESAPFVQAVWNVRDCFKGSKRMVVLLCKGLRLPVELQDDIVVLEEELPTAEELRQIVADMYAAAGVDLEYADTDRAIEALRGLSAFAAEQVTAMSMTRNGLDMDSLWKRKKQQVEQCAALKVLDDPESTFERIGGCAVIKDFVSRIMHGNGRPNAIVFVDEIEKCIGGQGDTSGVNQDQLGVLLSYMQDNKASGMIFVGPPGTAKSAIAKATGNEGGIPTLQLDLGAAKGSLVGQSEQQIREALKVITSISNRKSMWIATCNSIADLPPELRRRFTLGTYFFDLPTAEERATIWDIYRGAFGLSELSDPLYPHDEGWTGAEIKQCCEISWRLDCTLQEASQFIVPVSRSAADKIQSLRTQANGRFLSASVPGVYQTVGGSKQEPTTGRRKLEVE